MSNPDRPMSRMQAWWERVGRKYTGDPYGLAYLAWQASTKEEPGAIATAMTDRELLRDQELRGLIRPYPALPANIARPLPPNTMWEPVAHMLYSQHRDGTQTLHMCEAEDAGAFVVYRPAVGTVAAAVPAKPTSADKPDLPAIPKPSEKGWIYEARQMKAYGRQCADEREAFENAYQANWNDPVMAGEQKAFVKGYRAGLSRQPSAGDAEPLHITHAPLIRNAVALLRLRRPVTPDVELVASQLEAALEGKPTPAGEPSKDWLAVGARAQRATAQGKPE